MDKAIEAAAKAMDAAQDSFFETVGFETTPPSEFKRRLAKAAIRAYLSALKQDPEVVDRIGRAMLADELAARPRRDFDETWAQEDLIWLSNARAALSALEVPHE